MYFCVSDCGNYILGQESYGKIYHLLLLPHNVRCKFRIIADMVMIVKAPLLQSAICRDRWWANRRAHQQVTCLQYFSSDSNVIICYYTLYVERCPSYFIVFFEIDLDVSNCMWLMVIIKQNSFTLMCLERCILIGQLYFLTSSHWCRLEHQLSSVDQRDIIILLLPMVLITPVV